MNLTFFKYFFSFIFKSKTRQRLLFIAVFGLFISSFSLIIIQSVMSGLQNGLIKRSKNVLGIGHIEVPINIDYKNEIYNTLNNNNIIFYPELELELLVRNDNHLSPIIIHGIDYELGTPDFLLSKDREGVILSSELSINLNAYFSTALQFISPAHMDQLFGSTPRHVSEKVSDFYMSELSEIDSVHGWVRLSLLQNLIRKRSINKLRFYDYDSFKKAKALLPHLKSQTWEQEHRSLVWALNLETNVMLSLFVAMSFLVALCITTGFLIFFDKVKIDLLSFWVLGLSKEKVFKLTRLFTHLLAFTFSILGLLLGLGILYIISSLDFSFMPDFFVERSIPVNITTFNVLSSLFIPYFIAHVFSYFSFKSFKKEHGSFIKEIRKIL